MCLVLLLKLRLLDEPIRENGGSKSDLLLLPFSYSVYASSSLLLQTQMHPLSCVAVISVIIYHLPYNDGGLIVCIEMPFQKLGCCKQTVFMNHIVLCISPLPLT